MKNTFRVISAILIISLSFSLFVSAGFMNYQGYNEGENIASTCIEFFDNETNNKITSLTQGTTVKASCYVKKVSTKYQKASLVLNLFCGEDLVKSTVSYLALPGDGDYYLYNTISVPSIAGLTLYAYLWDGINTMTPLTEEALLSSNNASVSAILVDGQPLGSFNPQVREYTISLDASYNEYPVIAVRTEDLGAKVDIKELYSFSSSVKQIAINVTSQDGTETNYYILTFNQQPKEVTQASVNTGLNTTSIEKTVLNEPYWTSNAPTSAPRNNGTTSYLSSNMPASYTNIYTDQSYYYINISPELIGATVLPVASSLKNNQNATDPDNSNLISFKINHTADIYINTLNSENFTQLTDLGYERTNVLAYRIEPSSSTYGYFGNRFYHKKYTVNKGETVTVSIPYTNSSAMYSVMVKFSDGESRIVNAKYITKSAAVTNLDTVKLYNPVAAYGSPTSANSCLFKSKVYSDSSDTIGGLNEDMQGSDAISLPCNTGLKNIDSISFTLTRTCVLYFGWFESSSSMSASIDDMEVLSTENFTRYSSRMQMKYYTSYGVHNFPGYGGFFKKEYYLKPGETREVVLSGIPNTAGSTCAIFAGDINYDYYDSGDSFNIEPENSYIIEAEDTKAIVNEPFYRVTEQGQSVVKVRVGTEFNGEGIKDDNKSVIYPVSVEENGNYYLWLKTYAADTGRDSCYYALDNNSMSYLNFEFKPQWQWVLVKSEYMTRGKHQIKLYHREAGIMFDKLVVTKQPKYTPEDFTWDTLSYTAPSQKPQANVHPRLLVNSEKLNTIRANLSHEQNSSVYEKVKSDAKYNTNGLLDTQMGLNGTNADAKTIACAQSCAFLYLVDNDLIYGEKAVRILRNMVDSLTVIGSNTTYISRNIGWSLFAGALIYDWCYDLLDSELKEDFAGLYYIMASQLEVGWPPVKLGNVNTHAMEGELLKDFLAVGIAVYDEDPNIYNNVAGRVISELIPVKNHMNQSMHLTEGATYGAYREFYTMICTYMFDALGFSDIVNRSEQYLIYSLFYNRKPDGRFVSSGDDANEGLWGFNSNFNSILFLAGNYYKDSYLKREYYRGIKGGNTVINDSGTLGPVLHLLTNDVTVKPDKSFRDLPLTAFYNYPSGVMSSRTGWGEGINSDTMHVQMNIQQQFFGGHQHLDSGHFDIYYKGTLALDSGIYESASFKDSNGNTVTNLAYGSLHDFGYHKRTVAHNCMLVYEEGESAYNSYTAHNDGGQRMGYGEISSKTQLTDGTCDVGSVISYDFGEDLYNPDYSYLKGDLTKAYNSSKVSDYKRSFMFLNFKDENYPGALIVYDNITGVKELLSPKTKDKKSWLLHSQEEPVINGTRTTITRTLLPSNNGRLINDTLLPSSPTISKIGGSGNEFYVQDTNFTAVPKTDYTEAGNWRIEVSPPSTNSAFYGTVYDVSSEFLNVIQVSENNDSITPLATSLIGTVSGYNGVKIKDKIVYLKKTADLQTNQLTLAATDGEYMQIIDGLKEGVWTVKNSSGDIVKTLNVYEGHNTLSFTSLAGTYTLTKISDTNNITRDYSLTGRMVSSLTSPIDVSINNIYETFTNQPFISNSKLYLPAEELFNKLGANYTINGTTVTVNGTTLSSSYITQSSGVIYVSITDIATILGKTYTWDNIAKIAFIS